MQQLVIKGTRVVATHTESQDLTGKYPGCEIVVWNGPPVRPHGESGELGSDPRTSEQKAADAIAATIAAIRARHAQEASQGVTVSGGWRMRYTNDATADYARLKNLIELADGELPEITIVGADGVAYRVTAAAAMDSLREYARLCVAEIQRQNAELLAGE